MRGRDGHPVIAGGDDHRLLVAASTLAVDAATAEAVRALDAAGARSLLLKGPVLAELTERERAYGDADLLVAPSEHAAARAALVGLGYRPLTVQEAPVSLHARPWRRVGDGAVVDLHHALWGAELLPADAFALLWRHRDPRPLAGATVRMLDRPAAAFMVAAHACQHGAGVGKPVDDLRAALAVVDEETWGRAAELADRLGALRALAGGLDLDPAGRRLAGRLPLVRAQITARPGTQETLAIARARLEQAPDARRSAAVLARLVVPEPARLRAWEPLARRGRRGLAAAAVLRLARLARARLSGRPR